MIKETRTTKGTKEASEILKKYNHNLFTEKQLNFLKQREMGITYREIAAMEGISKQAIHERWKLIKTKV